eukprot:5835446-Pyramimonas_sp.AAC.1
MHPFTPGRSASRGVADPSRGVWGGGAGGARPAVAGGPGGVGATEKDRVGGAAAQGAAEHQLLPLHPRQGGARARR